MDATSIQGITVDVPAPGIFIPISAPSGDTADDIILGCNPLTGTLAWKRPHITGGASALTVNMPLIGRQWNKLYDGVNYADKGFRSQFVGYIPSGVWNCCDAALVVAGPSNVEFDIVVMQGMSLSTDPGRPNIVSENPIEVGGGVNTWPGAANIPFSIPFSASGIQFVGPAPQACEISVWVYPKVDGPAGAALGLIGNDATGNGAIPAGMVSKYYMRRERGV